MKRKGTLLVGIICFVVIMAAFVVHAQDATPEPGTPQENECNPGGVLYRAENQDGCPTEWYWKAGWYLSAVNNGRISRDDVPDEFKTVLPPPEESNSSDGIPELAIGSCWPHPGDGMAYQYLGPANTLRNVRGFGEGSCIRAPGGILERVAVVYAHNQSDAEAICSRLGEIDVIVAFPDMGIPMPPHVYFVL